MQNRRRFVQQAAALLPVAAAPAVAQGHASAAGSALEAFRQEILPPFHEARDKALALAAAIPESKYSWRPGNGVRSAGEVYMHIASGNRLLLMFLAPTPPSRAELEKVIRAGEDGEKAVTEKARIMENLKQSFEQVRAAIQKASEADITRKVKFFRSETTGRGIFVVIVAHISEHLGQSIAYARMNGIVPPWSAASGGAGED